MPALNFQKRFAPLVESGEKRQTIHGGADKMVNLSKKLDRVFSEYIRRRDCVQGTQFGHCITCGRLVPWKYADAGHYIKRQHKATRFDPQNVNLQCKSCNCFEQGANEKYKIAIDWKWGSGTAEKLEQRKRNRTDYRDWWYAEKIKEYQVKIKEMEDA